MTLLRDARCALALALLQSACGAPPSQDTSDASVTLVDAPVAPTDTPVTPTDAAVPAGLQLRPHAVNIVDAAAAEEARQYILGRSPQLYVGARTFYEHFGDDYDFLYIFTDGPVATATTYARFTPVRRPAIPSVGLVRVYRDAQYGDHTRLRGAVGVQFTAAGNGPTIHETLHYWSVFLDARFGFGRDRDMAFGAHWGLAGVNGQHGGFDPATLRCATPADAMPPCQPDPDGVTRVSMASFGPTANGGDSRAFAPLELYLMGLVPRAEITSPVLVLDGGHFVMQDATTRRLQFEITGTHTVSINDIVAVHGERPPAAAEDRAFRGAFVSFSDTPLSADRMDALERWAAIFGGDVPGRGLLSFAAATGDRATMDTHLGPAH